STYLCFLGYFFNNFLPTAIGGDVVKAYYAAKKSDKKLPAYSGVFMDRLLAMVPFTFIPAFAVFFAYKDIDSPLLIFFIYVLFVLTFFALAVILNKNLASYFKFLIKPFKNKNIYQKITKIYDSLNIYRQHKGVLAWSFCLALAGQVLSIISAFIAAKAIGVDYVGIDIFFLFIPIIGIMSMLPSINGLGVREAGFVYMFRKCMPVNMAFTISLLMLGILLGMSLIGAFIYMFGKNVYGFDAKKQENVI
ncbi:MAG: flippase-like domain-containing protein, partial [Candidatus Omnitrophica bacterium]|nr:flippase-like domain-containing protein [Candidatus Omnitrophota bacterium]